MVVPSLAIRVWQDEENKYWGEAPWTLEPVSGDSWEDVYEKLMQLKAVTRGG